MGDIEEKEKSMKECCRKHLSEQFGDDMEAIGEIYAEYVSSVGDKMAEADAAVAAGSWDTLDKVAHTIKGNALTVGDQQIADVAIALRSVAQQKDWSVVERLIADMKALATQL